MKYSEKLKDPRWQKKRLEIFERDGWACVNCYDARSPLHIHHKHYSPGADPWEYSNDILKTLCDFCHAVEHSKARCDECDIRELLYNHGNTLLCLTCTIIKPGMVE